MLRLKCDLQTPRIGALLTKELILILPILLGLGFGILQLIFIGTAYSRVSNAAEVAAGVAARGGNADEVHLAAGRVLAMYAGEYQTDIEFTGTVAGEDAVCVRVKIPMGVASPPFGGLIGNFVDEKYCIRSIVCRTLESSGGGIIYWGNSCLLKNPGSEEFYLDPGFEDRSPPRIDNRGIPVTRDGVIRNLQFRREDFVPNPNLPLNPFPGDLWEYRVYVNGIPTALFVTPTNATASASNNSVDVPVNQGDVVSIRAFGNFSLPVKITNARVSVSFDG